MSLGSMGTIIVNSGHLAIILNMHNRITDAKSFC